MKQRFLLAFGVMKAGWDIFDRITCDMSKKGFDQMWQQCWTQIKNLTQKYRKVRV